MIKVMMSLLLLLLFNGCSQKTKYIKSPCYKFIKVNQPKPITVSIKTKDLKLYKAYINEYRTKLDFMNNQVDFYSLNCKDNK